jgi:hypothetical protein
MKKVILFIFILYAIISGTKAQNVVVTSTLDTSRILIGDQINYTITIDKPSELNLSIPIFKDTLFKNIEIISGPLIDSSNLNGRTRLVGKYLITSFDSGYYAIPPVFVEIKSNDGIKRFFSDYSMLEVARTKIAPLDTALKIYDIIEPYRAPITLGEVLPWVLLAILICAIIWFIIRYIRLHKKNKAGVEPVKFTEPAHIIAFRELEILNHEEIWQKGETKKYYTRLTEILRQYLENRYQVFSLELTTEETLTALIYNGFRKDGEYNRLKTILRSADLVKFAKYNPEPSENELHYRNSWEFINNTKVEEINLTTSDVNDRVKEAEK